MSFKVRLTNQERDELRGAVKKLKGTSQKVRRAQIFLQSDADGPNWTDQPIAQAFWCQTRTVEKIRQRLVERGFEETLNGAERAHPPVEKLLDGAPEARIIATRLGPPPKGDADWTLRRLAGKVVERFAGVRVAVGLLDGSAQCAQHARHAESRW